MSFKSYRAIDLTIWTAIMLITELILSYASNTWFVIDSLGISIVLPLLIIVAMRWGWLSVIPAVICGFATCFFSKLSGGTTELNVTNIIITELGYLTVLFSLLWFKFLPKEKTKASWGLCFSLVITIYILYCAVKGVASAIAFGENLFSCFISFLMVESVTLLFAEIIILIVRKLEGIFEDQKSYLIKLEKQREEEKNKIKNK